MNIQNHLLLVVNPISGNYPKIEIIDLILIETEKRKLKVRIYETTGKSDEIEIEKLILGQHFDRIIAIGGDGTVQMVARVAQKHAIPIGIIPAGSANGLAVNFNIPTNLQQQIEIVLADCTLPIDILTINNHLCLHIADLGINAELIKNYEDSGIRGKLGYLVQSIPTLFQNQGPIDFEIEANGTKYFKKGILLAIANANKFGTGAVINPKGKINDGLFEVLIFKNMDFFKILKTLNDKAELDSEFVESITTTEVVIRCLSKVPFQIDGEYMGEVDKIEAKILEQKLEIALTHEFCEENRI